MSIAPNSNTHHIRELLARELRKQKFVGVTVELIGSSFIADAPMIFGAVDPEYVERELEWYMSRSLNVNDIPNGPPKIWAQVADPAGHINSNYGFLMWSPENYSQVHSVITQLRQQPGYGRRAVAIYTRPSIHVEWHQNGMSDFICTNAVNYYERDGSLDAVVQMRSNDAVFGYRNDLAWQQYLVNYIAGELAIKPGKIVWQAGSLHVYERHYPLIEHYIDTGEYDIPLGQVKEAKEAK